MEHSNIQIRLKQFDYSQPGYYFVTISTKGREEFFGSITEGEMHLNKVGEIAEQIWLQIPKSYPMVSLDQNIVMPNHVHGIIIIGSVEHKDGRPRPAATGLHALVPNSLPSIVNHYKGAVKKECNRNGHANFAWQSRFYDHVIRKDESLDKIREYILNNPKKWDLDRNNPENVWM